MNWPLILISPLLLAAGWLLKSAFDLRRIRNPKPHHAADSEYFIVRDANEPVALTWEQVRDGKARTKRLGIR